ncbi:MAG TPA: type II secretion system F family protein [Methylophilaceae bacterium]|jgi:general secretion pathway protein F|nr:type II secretion system F family protein [Methylophilaceae bacterium]
MRYRVKALNKDGAVMALTLDAASVQDARQIASGQGLSILSTQTERNVFARLLGRRSNFPLSLFCQELKVLLAAGITLVDALETLAEREQKSRMGIVLERLVSLLREGRTLADAMERIPEAFPPLFSASVRASETSGEIVEALGRYLAYQGQVDAIRKKVVSASVYPAMIIVFGSLVLLFMLGYVVPRFSTIYADRGEAVSFASRMLLQWGGFVSAHGYEIAAYAGAGLVALVFWLRQPGARAWLLSCVRRIPAIGRILQIFFLARLYRTLGMLLRGGIPAVSALEMASGVLESGLRSRLEAARHAIREGLPLSEAFYRHGLTTPVAMRLLRVAEQTGSMSEMLESAAAFHEEELARAVDLFTRLFEPALMMVIGLLVGAVVLLMYMPIFELAGAVG